MPDRPTLHLTNWSSRKLHGPGRRWTIMARPRRWEHGDGSVAYLTPLPRWLDQLRNGEIDVAEYKRRYLIRIRHVHALRPGKLLAFDGPGSTSGTPRVVIDGDTLCCACSRADAAAGRCHRVWAAELLVAAGWRVILDGAEVPRD